MPGSHSRIVWINETHSVLYVPVLVGVWIKGFQKFLVPTLSTCMCGLYITLLFYTLQKWYPFQTKSFHRASKCRRLRFYPIDFSQKKIVTQNSWSKVLPTEFRIFVEQTMFGWQNCVIEKRALITFGLQNFVGQNLN